MIQLLHRDCMEFIREQPDNAFDLAIVDPPYGIGMNGHRIAPKARPVPQNSGQALMVSSTDYGVKEWDDAPPPPEYFTELVRVSRNQVIWGANHFIDRVPYPSPCWLVWDKVNGDTDQADCELAWASFKTAVRRFAFMWNGMCQGSPENGRKMQGNKALNEDRIHPTQKPVQLYRWILQNYAKSGDHILDTHGGSMSSGVACAMEGFDATILEIDADYFAGGSKRVREAEMMALTQPGLFARTG